MYIILEKRVGQKAIEHVVDDLTTFQAEPGSVYTIQEPKSAKVPENLLLRKDGSDLLVEVDGKEVARIENFFAKEVDTTFSTDGSYAPTDTMMVSSSDALELNGDTDIIWQPASSGFSTGWAAGLVLAAGGGIALATSGSSSDKFDNNGNNIVNKEPSVTLSIDNTTPTEAGTDTVTITATLDKISDKDVTVNLSYDGTASGGGVDYTGGDPTIVIRAGDTTGTTSLTVKSDNIRDTSEMITVDVNDVINGVEDGTQQVTATIKDINTSIVVFDLTAGTSSDHSERVFKTGIDYTIYIKVDSKSHELTGMSAGQHWKGITNLDSGDMIMFIGNSEGGIWGNYNGKVGTIKAVTHGNNFLTPSITKWQAETKLTHIASVDKPAVQVSSLGKVLRNKDEFSSQLGNHERLWIDGVWDVKNAPGAGYIATMNFTDAVV
ncbi:MAG: hypothetical protein OCC45_09835 [Desulfotalea sp.]